MEDNLPEAKINSVDFMVNPNTLKNKTGDVMIADRTLYDDATENSNFDQDNPEDILSIQDIDTEEKEFYEDKEENDTEIRAQIDTGAKVSVTNLQHVLHGYIPFKDESESPVRLTGAIDDGSAICPKGAGFLRIPARNRNGFVDVHTFYSPELTSTLVSENGILIGSLKKKQLRDYYGQSISKVCSNT